jgi:hypothetical protein
MLKKLLALFAMAGLILTLGLSQEVVPAVVELEWRSPT